MAVVLQPITVPASPTTGSPSDSRACSPSFTSGGPPSRASVKTPKTPLSHLNRRISAAGGQFPAEEANRYDVRKTKKRASCMRLKLAQQQQTQGLHRRASQRAQWAVPELVNVRALELLEGAVIGDLLLRDYARDQLSLGKKLVTVRADDLYIWFKKKNILRVSTLKVFVNVFNKKKSKPAEDDEEDDVNDGEDNARNPFDQYCLACSDRLENMLTHDIALFWRDVDQSDLIESCSSGLSVCRRFSETEEAKGGARHRSASAESFRPARPLELFKRKVAFICKNRRAQLCLRVEIEKQITSGSSIDSVPACLQRDDASIRRSDDYSFWKLYHLEEAVTHHSLQGAGGQAAARAPSRPTLRMSQTMNKLGNTGVAPISSSSAQSPIARQCSIDERVVKPSISTELLPPWMPSGAASVTASSRPNSKTGSRPNSKASRRTAGTPPQKSGSPCRKKRLEMTQSELDFDALIHGLPKTLPSRIVAAPPPAKPANVDPFRALRASQSTFSLTSMDRHSRQTRSHWLRKVGKEQRASKNTLPSISTALQSCAASLDAEFASREMRQCASESALKGGMHAELDVRQDSNKLPPVLGLAGHSQRMPACKSSLSGLDTHTAEMSAMKYIEVCRTSNVVPRQLVLSMSRTSKIDVWDRYLTDDDLFALKAMVKSLDCLKSVDLSGNVLLSDNALVGFMKELYGNPAECSLVTLKLGGCHGCGRQAVQACVSLITNGLLKLQTLDLNSVAIPMTSCLPLCNAICTHPSLRNVHLANTGLGFAPMGKLCVTNLLVSPRIEVLDLSWNCFSEETFKALGEAIVNHKAIKTLSLANCTGSRCINGEVPVSGLLEYLCKDKSLRSLDLSSNQLDFRGALVLECALAYHSEIKEVRLGGNPLGTEGLRCFMRLVSRNTCGLVNFECSNCEGIEEDFSRGEIRFNPCNATGPYELDLGRTYHRTVLRMLYSLCARLHVIPEGCFRDFTFTPGASTGDGPPAAFEHPKKLDASCVWTVPQAGHISTVFVLDDIFDNLAENLRNMNVGAWVDPSLADVISPPVTLSNKSPQPLATHMVAQYRALTRSRPNFSKIAPLLSYFMSIKGEPHEQKLLLTALSYDFCFSFAHIHELCQAGSTIAEDISLLLSTLAGGASQQYLVLTRVAPDIESYVNIRRTCQHWFALNLENPTAHYELNLWNASDYAVTETLCLLDRWEATMARKKGDTDLSMHGNWSSVRNCYYQNTRVKSLGDVRLPPQERLEMDFVSWRRPPEDAVILEDRAWKRLLVTISSSWSRTIDKTTVLKRISGMIWIKALQLRELVGLFPDAKMRIEIISCLVLRVTDPQNMKVMIACMADKEDWYKVVKRLGILTLFPFYQPEEVHFEMDLNLYEDRMATALAVQMAANERLENIRDPTLINADGSPGNLDSGISSLWQHVESLPHGGKIIFDYVCGPEERRFCLRKDMSRKYGNWRANVQSSQDVMWWKTLLDAPDYLLMFLYNCMNHFKSAAQVFKLCNVSHSGRISRNEFEMMIADTDWQVFKRDPSLVKQLFRHLDPNHSGDISFREWSSLQYLWNELELTILELLRFLDRNFSGNLEMAWDELDDGSGKLDLYSWQDAVRRVGYYGHTEPIFFYAAEDNGRDVAMTPKSWEKLQAVWRNRDELLRKITSSDQDFLDYSGHTAKLQG